MDMEADLKHQNTGIKYNKMTIPHSQPNSTCIYCTRVCNTHAWNLVVNEVLSFYCILFMIPVQQDALTHN
jgi:hypothetical protein